MHVERKKQFTPFSKAVSSYIVLNVRFDRIKKGEYFSQFGQREVVIGATFKLAASGLSPFHTMLLVERE